MEKYIQIRIRENTEVGQFSDALYFTEDEFNNLDPKDLELMVQERVNNWITAINTPSIPIEVTKEQLQEQAIELQRQLEDIQWKISEKEALEVNEIIN